MLILVYIMHDTRLFLIALWVRPRKCNTGMETTLCANIYGSHHPFKL
jgi:hypothetical protein